MLRSPTNVDSRRARRRALRVNLRLISRAAPPSRQGVLPAPNIRLGPFSGSAFAVVLPLDR